MCLVGYVMSAFTVADRAFPAEISHEAISFVRPEVKWTERFCDRKILARDLCWVFNFSVV
jgi:hypothetical protein